MRGGGSVVTSLAKQSVLRGVFKYRADVGPVALVLAVSALALVPFLFALPGWALFATWAVVFYARTFAAFAQHNHAHLATFNWGPLNNLYDAFLTQNTGYPTSLWELHHNRGHHRHFLTPDQDVASITYPGTTRVMSRGMYALRGNLLIHRDSIRIGRAERRAGKRSLLPKLFGETLLQALLTAALLFWNWPLALAFVVVPNFLSAFLIWWQSYPHHKEMPCTGVYDGSMTVESPTYNRVTFNIGHHTAHHEKPTLHWSLLPARTAQIRERIHPECFRDTHATVGAGMAEKLINALKRPFVGAPEAEEGDEGVPAE
jgi:fatty acid desaturase